MGISSGTAVGARDGADAQPEAEQASSVPSNNNPERIMPVFTSMPQAAGSRRRNDVPRPTVDSTSTSPPCSCTIRYTIDKPMPLPSLLVV